MLCHVIDRKRILKVVEGVARIQWTLRRDALISGPKSIVLLSAYLPKVRCCYLPCWTFHMHIPFPFSVAVPLHTMPREREKMKGLIRLCMT